MRETGRAGREEAATCQVLSESRKCPIRRPCPGGEHQGGHGGQQAGSSDCRTQTPRSVPVGLPEGFASGSDGKESACDAGDLGSIPGLGRPPEGGHGSPLQYSCLENPHGQRSLVSYRPWGHKESEATE